MKKGIDIGKRFPEVQIYHHNLPGKKVTKENQNEHHLIIPISGNVMIETRGKVYKFGPSKMMYIPAGSPHLFESHANGSGERIVLIIQDRFWKKNCEYEFDPILLSINNLIKELLLHILLNCETLYHKSLSATIIHILEELIINKGRQAIDIDHLFAKTSDIRLTRALEFIQKNTRSKLVMGTISDFSGMSSRNLNRVFSEEFGINPKELHHKIRMEEARDMLKIHKVSVTETCFEMGFSSLSQFIKAFKKTLGSLPSEV